MVDTLMAVIMFAILIPGILWYLNTGTKTTVNASVAQQMKLFQRPIERFTRDNYAAILATATPTSAYELPPSGLVPLYMNSLPNGAVDPVYGRNPFDQRYRIFYLQPTPGVLQVFVITENGKTDDGTPSAQTFVNIDIPSIASMIGSSGGFVTGAGNPLGLPASRLVGSFKSWQFNPAGTSIATSMTLAGGHIVMNLNFDKGQLTTDFLNRYDTGDVEVNTMRTDVHMGNNSIDTANNITASGTIQGGLINSDTHVNAMQNVTVGNGAAVLSSNGNTSLTQAGSLTVQNFGGVLQSVFGRELNSNDGYMVAPGTNSRLNNVSLTSSKVTIEDKGNMLLSDLLPNFIFKDSWYAGNGSVVPKPACSAGQTARVMLVSLVEPTFTELSTVAAPGGWTPRTIGAGYTRHLAIDAGASWSISLAVWRYFEGVGMTWSGDSDARVLAHTYCGNNM